MSYLNHDKDIKKLCLMSLRKVLTKPIVPIYVTLIHLGIGIQFLQATDGLMRY